MSLHSHRQRRHTASGRPNSLLLPIDERDELLQELLGDSGGDGSSRRKDKVEIGIELQRGIGARTIGGNWNKLPPLPEASFCGDKSCALIQLAPVPRKLSVPVVSRLSITLRKAKKFMSKLVV